MECLGFLEAFFEVFESILNFILVFLLHTRPLLNLVHLFLQISLNPLPETPCLLRIFVEYIVSYLLGILLLHLAAVHVVVVVGGAVGAVCRVVEGGGGIVHCRIQESMVFLIS